VYIEDLLVVALANMDLDDAAVTVSRELAGGVASIIAFEENRRVVVLEIGSSWRLLSLSAGKHFIFTLTFHSSLSPYANLRPTVQCAPRLGSQNSMRFERVQV
jgi:hypothetical protein